MPDTMTIVEYAKDSDDLTRAYVELFAETSDVLAALPFMNVSGGAYKYTREDDLPGIAFRGINEIYTASVGVENPLVESLFVAGGEVDVDAALLRMNGRGRKAREERKKIKSMARAVTDVIMFGDNTTEPREFDGLQRRLTGTQKLSNNTGSGGGALSLTKLDEAISRTVEPTHIICNRKFRDVHFAALMRNQTLTGNVNLTKDDLGRKLMTYNGLPMLVGYEVGPDAAFLPYTEAASVGGQAQTSSIYIVSFKEGHISGIQSQPMSVKDLGELQSQPAERVRVEWDTGLVIENGYAGTRLHDITDAAIVA